MCAGSQPLADSTHFEYARFFMSDQYVKLSLLVSHEIGIHHALLQMILVEVRGRYHIYICTYIYIYSSVIIISFTVSVLTSPLFDS